MRLSGLALLLALLLVPPATAAEISPLRAAVHVHTTLSTGDLSLEDVVREARRQRIDAVILTENLLLRFEYGLFPLDGLVRKVVERPSVRRTGIARYLQAVQDAQARAPDVLLIPGVEVVPHYYWTGSPWNGSLTMWDAQKNLLVVGLDRPEDYEAIPAIGAGGGVPGDAIGLVKLTVAGLAGAVGVWLLRMRRQRTVKLTHFTLRVERRYRLPGWAALALAGLVATDAVLASASGVPHTRGSAGMAPYQRVIDHAESRGGAAVWSYPEARDFGRFDVGRFGPVTVRTEPYPEALLATRGYTAFGAVYEDTVTLTEPGRQWDQLLLEYTRGRRPRPAWGLGELGFHGHDKRLGGVLTVFLVRERSPAAIVESLRAGRLYAVRPLPDYHLVLEEFSLSQAGGQERIPMGGELAARGASPLRIRIRIVASDGRAAPFAMRLIRSGTVLAVLERTTPFEDVLAVAPPEPGAREFYRVEVTRPHRLLANPIFAGRRAG